MLHVNHFFYNIDTVKHLLFPEGKKGKQSEGKLATHRQMDQVYFVKLCSNHCSVVLQMHSLSSTRNQHTGARFHIMR